ncbi:hypothetical protein F5H01DRAFT_366337 [Linnemannia elongata]|nr:hypothetical protein F5H01DRAFT_366337 [Linnemannia elongata]
MSHITLLPYEILVLIANYLDKNDLAVATRTCRQLERHFTPRLWRVFVLRGSRRGKYHSIDAVTKNAPSVHSLEYVGTPPRLYYTIAYPNLKTLHIDLPMTIADIQHARIRLLNIDNSTLVSRNPTITHLYINSGDFETNNGFWESVFMTLKNPRRLDFHGFRVLQGDALDWFWRACTRFEEISVSGHGFANSPVLSTVSFSRIQRLTVYLRAHIPRGTTAGGSIEWFKMCPNLTKLHTFDYGAEFPIEAFAKALEQHTWTRLTDLALIGCVGSDDRLSLIMRHLPPLEHFQHDSRGFGPQSFAFLQQRLFDNVRTLDMQGCHGLLSRMILDILKGCPLLEVFKAFSISVTDIRSNPEPWICLRLKHLEVFFVTDPTRLGDDCELVFEQLSRLESLETLDLDLHFTWTFSWDILDQINGQVSLRWRLDSGLHHLSTLRRLRTLVINSSFCDARMEDVQWMLDRWPDLKKVTCSLSQDPVTKKRCVGLFEQHNVILKLNDGWGNHIEADD